jgi:cation:H+ antiporter
MFLLLKIADIFLENAIKIGEYLHMSKILIGLTFVAIGSSAPELLTSLSSFFFTSNYPDFIIGTTIGSNITNILLAFGLFLFFSKKIKLNKQQQIKNFDILSLFFITFGISIFIFFEIINYFILIFFFFYIFYIIYNYKSEKENGKKEKLNSKIKEDNLKQKSKTYFLFFLTIFCMFLLSKSIIISLEFIGNYYLVPISIMTLIVLSIGTSLPEILVSYSAAKKKEYGLAITNILGTNIMNVCLIIGTSGFFGKYNITFNDYFIPVIFFIISTLYFLYILYFNKLTKNNSFVMFLLYFLYVLFLIF